MQATDFKLRLRRVRILLMTFIVLLVLSGITAFTIKLEMDFAVSIAHLFPTFVEDWLRHVHAGVSDTWTRYPFIPYGTDWLAFAHIVLAVFFFGPWKDPVRNIWVIEAGMIACLLVIPLAMIMGPIRGIPFWWRLVDCSFGVFGIILLGWIRREILAIEASSKNKNSTTI